MRIAVDAMGSDQAPLPEVMGAVRAANERDDLEVILVGDEDTLKATLARARRKPQGKISIVHASEAIKMDDQPVLAVRKKKDASLLVAMRLVKTGDADAVVSAGNTGAVMVAARTILRPIEGVSRSAICQFLPATKNRRVLTLDLGANVDCSARHLCDFAEMGVQYVRRIAGVEKPRVGLLNIGEESVKGNDLAKTVNKYLTAMPHLNFVGNVEPKGLFGGVADVVVCDGFAGNLLLKSVEASGMVIKDMLAREFKATPLSMIGAIFGYGAFRRLKRAVDPNRYTGAELLGVNGVVIILHGSCNARGVANGIQGGRVAVKKEINKYIREGIQELRATVELVDSSEVDPESTNQ